MLSSIILLQNIKWMIPAAILIGSAPGFFSIWAVWRILSAPLPEWIYVKGDDLLFSTYHRNLLFFFETMSGVEILFYGDSDAVEKQDTGENCIFISNHQCTVDWVLGSSLSLRRGSLGRTRYVLKDGLRYLPLYGIYLQMHGCIFVKRAGRFKKTKVAKLLEKNAMERKPMWLVIFPEGTRYNPEHPKAIHDSQEFAKSKGLEPLNQVLYPRSKAMSFSMEYLSQYVDSVYDITVAYENTYDFRKKRRKLSPTMQDFLMGTSKRLHLHVKRIPIREVPVDEAELKNWLYQKYQEKDRLMEYFYKATNKDEMKFPGEPFSKQLSVVDLLPSVLFWSGGFVAVNLFEESRSLYWKLGFGLSVFGVVWMSIK